VEHEEAPSLTPSDVRDAPKGERRRSSSRGSSQITKAVLGVDPQRLRRRVIRHSISLAICQTAVIVGYFLRDRQALHVEWSSLSRHWLVALTTPIWICLPYALVAESVLRRLQFVLLAVLPVVAIIPAVYFIADTSMEGGAAAGGAFRTGGWLTLIFLTYWVPLLAIWRRQRDRVRREAGGHRSAAASKRGWFCCYRCWRPMHWDTRRSIRDLSLLILMRPAVCDSCRKWRLVPIFWKHRKE
jgi:hypothetical protein